MRCTTLSIITSLSVAACAQNYLANDPIWRQTSVCGVSAPCIAYDTFNYYTAGDSLIGGMTWTKVWRQGSMTVSWQDPGPIAPGCLEGTYPYGEAHHGVSLIRQEGRALHIWADGSDQLLFDFDLTIGQMLPLTWNNWNTDITVLAVDSVLIGTEMRARYELGNSWAQYLIEGVGSSHGLFEPISNFFDCGYALDCFGLGDVAYYPNMGPGCMVVMGVDPLALGRTAFVMAPNPANELVMLSGLRSREAITVFDGTGRMVHQGRPVSGNAALDTRTLPAGAYTVVHGADRQRLLVIR